MFNNTFRQFVISLLNGKGVYWYAKTLRNEIALTFDDGPDKKVTPLILDILKSSGVKATFFVVGEKARVHSDIIKKIVDGGHDIGNHTYSHKLMADLNWDELQQEIEKTDNLLKQIIGFSTEYFRLPKGQWTFLFFKLLLFRTKKVIFWNIDPRDYKARSSREIVDFLRHELVSPGSIILLHDRIQYTADALNSIIEMLYDKDFKPVTLSQLLGR